MLARGGEADVNVIALVGERGREVNEFIHDNLGAEGLARSIVVVATSDRPALERSRAAWVATAIAEHFRDQGKRVLLLLDSVTRFARALRDVGLAVGEPPARRGYPPSVFSALPRLFERAGNNDRGSITAFYTVLAEDEDGGDPIAEEVRSILDGHIVLSRKLASAYHYPAIDVLTSLSRMMPRVVDPTHQRAAGQLRKYLAKYQDIELLLQLGEYKRGSDPRRRHRDREDRSDPQAAAAARRRAGAVRAVVGCVEEAVRMKRYPLHVLVKLREHRTETARQLLLERQRAAQACRDACVAIEGEIVALQFEQGQQRQRLLDPPPAGCRGRPCSRSARHTSSCSANRPRPRASACSRRRKRCARPNLRWPRRAPRSSAPRRARTRWRSAGGLARRTVRVRRTGRGTRHRRSAAWHATWRRPEDT